MSTALLLAGRTYPPSAPLLWFPRLVAEQHGWTTAEVLWAGLPADPDDFTEHVHERTRAVLSETTGGDGDPVLVIAKSLGTLAAPLAAEAGWPAVWITPLLHQPHVVDALAANPAPQFVIAGAADPFHDRDVAADLKSARGVEVLEVPAADHLLSCGDAVRDAEVLTEVTRAVTAFVAGLR